jgi:hypothetical protein
MSHITDIGDYLEFAGIVSEGTTLFYDELDDSQDNCIAISDYQGFNEYETQDGGGPDQQNINIIVRYQDKQACWNKAQAVYNLLREHYNETIGSTFFIELTAKGPHTYLRKTKNKSTERTINFYSKYI